MGSVIDYIQCPRCKNENCIDDYYWKTGEECINCPDCGYSQSFRYKRDNDGNLLKKDETKGYEFENLIMEEIHLENPYGSYRIELTNGGGMCGTLETDVDYQNFISEISILTNQEHNIKTALVSKLIGSKIEKEVVFQLF